MFFVTSLRHAIASMEDAPLALFIATHMVDFVRGAVERVEDGKRVLERARRPRAVGRHRGQVRVAELFVARAERAPRVDGGPGPRRAPIAAARRVRVVARLLRESRVRRHVEHDLVRRGVAAQFEAARRVAFALGRRQHGFELHALQ